MQFNERTTTPDTQTLMATLARPEAFPLEAEALPEHATSVLQTHASVVFLTSTRAYKIKKSVNLGFLDYTSPIARRRFCIDEYQLNQTLAPGVYLGIAPIIREGDGTLRFGETCSPDATPHLGASQGAGVVTDTAVVMRRLPDECTLAALVATGAADDQLMRDIARKMASFHSAAEDGPLLAPYGAIDIVRGNIEQTIQQTEAAIDVTVAAADHKRMRAFATDFMDKRTALMESRARAGRMRDCHGDLRMEHVYLLPPDVPEEQRLLIVDRIEFDARYRYGDVAGEIAFLAIELECAGRADLARGFVNAYIHETGDTGLREIFPLYQVYRAMVRGKVRSMLLEQAGLTAEERHRARDEAEDMFALASHYAGSPTTPIIGLIGGLMGTGKSTLALELHNVLGWPLLSSDVTRKQLAGLDPALPVPAADRAAIYSDDWTQRVYARLLEDASSWLTQGYSVLVDASFGRRDHRQAWMAVQQEQERQAVFLECVCPRDLAVSRLTRRWQTKLASANTADRRAKRDSSYISASDGRPELYDQQATAWEQFHEEQEATLQRAVIHTDIAVPQQVEQALAAFGIPTLACWLR